MQDSDGAIHCRAHFVRVHLEHCRRLTNAEVLSEAESQHGMIPRVERCGHPCRTASHSIVVAVLFTRHVPYDADPVDVPRIPGRTRKGGSSVIRPLFFGWFRLRPCRREQDPTVWRSSVMRHAEVSQAEPVLAIAASLITTSKNIDTSSPAPQTFGPQRP
jgi:hypothetical protein